MCDVVRLTSTGTVSTVVVRLPADARQTDICLRWQQSARTTNDSTTTNSTGCWALDNVLVNNMDAQPISIQDNFDPVDPGNWLFFPGARIMVCRVVIRTAGREQILTRFVKICRPYIKGLVVNEPINMPRLFIHM